MRMNLYHHVKWVVHVMQIARAETFLLALVIRRGIPSTQMGIVALSTAIAQLRITVSCLLVCKLSVLTRFYA